MLLLDTSVVPKAKGVALIIAYQDFRGNNKRKAISGALKDFKTSGFNKSTVKSSHADYFVLRKKNDHFHRSWNSVWSS